MPLFTAESLGPVVTVLLILQPPSLAAIVRLLSVCVFSVCVAGLRLAVPCETAPGDVSAVIPRFSLVALAALCQLQLCEMLLQVSN